MFDEYNIIIEKKERRWKGKKEKKDPTVVIENGAPKGIPVAAASIFFCVGGIASSIKNLIFSKNPQ